MINETRILGVVLLVVALTFTPEIAALLRQLFKRR